MKQARHVARLSILFLASACGGEEHVDITTITNETAHQAAADVAKEADAIASMDSLPQATADSIKASQAERQRVIQQALKDSKYATVSDRALDSTRQAWIEGYSRSCDPKEFDRIMGAFRTDEVLKQWSGQHLDSARAYHDRLVATRKVCESRAGQ